MLDSLTQGFCVGGFFLKRKFIIILILAIGVKLSLFICGTMSVPESRMMPDSASYMEIAKNLAERGQFERQGPKSVFAPEILRTPGYPFFLLFFHHCLNIPILGVLFIQLMLTVAVGGITYFIAQRVDSKIALLSATIVLFDPPVSIFSVMVLTEALFLLLLTIFLFLVIQYMNDKKFYWLGWSALSLALATYVRPIGYFLAIPVACFIVCVHRRYGFKRVVGHILIFLALVYGLLGAWQVRNYYCCGTSSFATVGNQNFRKHGFFRSFTQENDLFSQAVSFVDTGWRCFLSMMTEPGSLKYFKSTFATKIGKSFFYPWMAFWFMGFLAGCLCVRKDTRYQFLFMVILYFLGVTILNIGFAASDRFRVPIVPAIAILSAYGWSQIVAWAQKIWSRRCFKCC